MIVKDRIYGTFNIESSAIIELIKSKPLKRLKKIAQYGIPEEFYHLKSYSRLEHSIGVMLLLKKFGATEKEQIAGLLHDVSHTAFSHLIDWFVGSGETEDFQDKQHEKFIKKSEVATILKQHGYTPTLISQYRRHTLLEQPLPRLCADRLDYSLREFPIEVAKKCLNGLTAVNGRFVFKDKKTAEFFARYFMKYQKEHWGGVEAVMRYTILAQTIKLAMKKGIVRFADFWQYDEYILRKLRSIKDEQIQKNLLTLRKKSLISLPRSNKRLRKKFRFIDPEVLIKGRRAPLSEINFGFKKFLQKQRKINDRGIRIAIV